MITEKTLMNIVNSIERKKQDLLTLTDELKYIDFITKNIKNEQLLKQQGSNQAEREAQLRLTLNKHQTFQQQHEK
ncbi:hypothetical protein LCGC14_2707180, partial [marine sediment metagenome]